VRIYKTLQGQAKLFFLLIIISVWRSKEQRMTPLLETNSAVNNVEPVELICGIADIKLEKRFLGLQ
jgi:hypothetical protein